MYILVNTPMVSGDHSIYGYMIPHSLQIIIEVCTMLGIRRGPCMENDAPFYFYSPRATHDLCRHATMWRVTIFLSSPRRAKAGRTATTADNFLITSLTHIHRFISLVPYRSPLHRKAGGWLRGVQRTAPNGNTLLSVRQQAALSNEKCSACRLGVLGSWRTPQTIHRVAEVRSAPVTARQSGCAPGRTM